MPNPNQSLNDAFGVGPGAQSEVRYREQCYFGRSMSIVTLTPWTITNTNCTPAVTNVGASPLGRPCATFHGAGAATDGTNFGFPVGGILLQAGKPASCRLSYYSADIANHEMAFGIGAYSTGMIAADPTDYVMLRFTTGQTVPHLRCRKASGAAGVSVDVPLNIIPCEPSGALQSATWYDFEWRVTPDPNVSGAGHLEVSMGRSGQNKVKIYDANTSLGIPDTVAISPFVAGRAGGSVSTLWYWGEYELEVAS